MADDAPAPPPPTLEAVIVQPPRLAPLGGEAVFATQEIGAGELKLTPRLDEALTRTPGASLFRRTGSDAANPTIQGLSLRAIAPSGAGRALVTLDGAPQNDPFGGWVIWSALPPEGLASATLVRGAGAGPYGAGALTGVAALRELPAGEGVSALDVSGGGRGAARVAIAAGSPELLVTASAQSSDGYVPVRGPKRGAADRPTGLTAGSMAFRVQRRLSEIDAALRVSAYEEQRGAGLAGAKSTASGGSAVLTLARPAAEDRGGWRAQAWIRSSDLKNSSVAVAADRSAATPANDQYATPALGYGFNGAWQVRHGPWAWEAGFDARFSRGEVRERFRFMGGGFTRGREAGGETAVGGLYAEGVLDRGDLILAGGVRLDAWDSRDGFRRERDLASRAALLDERPQGASGTTPTGRFGLRARLAETVWARGAAYAGFRPPTLNELHRPFRVGNDVTEANPQLKPERLYGVEAGLDGESRMRWSVTAFYNRLEDPITNVTVGVGPATFPIAGFIPAGGVLRRRQNAGAIDAYGLEGDLTASLARDLSLHAAFSATHARVDGGGAVPQLTGKRPAQTPVLTLVAGIDWRTGERLSLNAELRFESARFEDDLNTRRLGSALTADLRAGWRLGADSELYVAAENLFNARVEVGETADGVESFAAPRTVRLGFALRR